jgi:hypothetical protein
MALWDSFVSRTMSAILSDFHFTFDAACVAQMPLRVFAEPQSSVIEAAKPEVIESRSLVDLYDELLSASDKERRVSIKTIRDNRSALDKFETWGRTQHRVVAGRPLSLLEQPKILRGYAEFLRAQPKGNSSAMASKACSAIGKLAGACVRAGMLKQKPETVSKSTINLLRPLSEEQRRVKAVPVTVAELQAMLNVVDGCKWPRLGNVKPSVFWQTNLLSHYVYGFRSQDWFAARSSEKQGLRWSGVITESQCPFLDDLHNEAGWALYLVHKTANKDEAADRPSDVLVPLSWKMRELIEQFRGLDPERVFPMKNNSRTYSEEFSKLLERAGLSDEMRRKEKKPIIRLSLGQRKVASFRKGSSALWAKYVSRAASSYMLHHAVSEEGVAKMTSESYLQNEEILRDIVAKIESLPVWSF